MRDERTSPEVPARRGRTVGPADCGPEVRPRPLWCVRDDVDDAHPVGAVGADAGVAGQGHELGEDGGDGAGGGGADAQGADAGGDAAAGEASAAVGTRHAQADDGAAGAVLGDEDGGEALALGEIGGQGAAPVAPARVEAGGQGGGGDLGDVVAAGGEDGGGEQADVPGGGGGLGGDAPPEQVQPLIQFASRRQQSEDFSMVPQDAAPGSVLWNDSRRCRPTHRIITR